MSPPVRVTAIVPVKTLRLAKRRLAAVLPDEMRARLVLTMLEDVLAAAGQVEAIDRIVVITPDARVDELAQKSGASVLRERRASGLDDAVRRGLAHAAGAGAEQALVLPADVPLATPDELRRVLQAKRGSARARLTLVPAADADGTNAVAAAPPDAFQPSFGTGSFLRHLAQAVANGLELEVLRLPGLGCDIDEPRDLARLLSHPQARKRYGFVPPHALASPEARPETRRSGR